MTAIAAAQAFVDRFNADYEAKHEAFEKQFWGTKMALKNTSDIQYSAEKLSETKTEMERLLSDPAVRQEAEQHKAALSSSSSIIANNNDIPTALMQTLDIIIRTNQCYSMPPNAAALREETSVMESQLELARNQMKLGYINTNGVFVEKSSVGLRNTLRTAQEEADRKAAYEALRSIGPFVLEHGFVEIIKLRNRLAKLLGFVDYYDYKVTNAEGFGKERLFEILDGLEQGTRPIMVKARQELVEKYGADAAEPWNTSFKMAGSVIAKMDPYFPFSKSVEQYVRSYARLGISYADATMYLDLLERKSKYSNGFCAWPKPAWIKPDGTWQPSVANFTSLADPSAVGSGLTALTTLMHEAGHAAHFANVKQPSPLFSQERAPTSVAYAENQSMFLDSLVGDGAWRAIYAKNLEGTPIPFEIHEEEIRATHPFSVFQLRAMLSVSYFEKALYELPEEQVTAENVQKLADQIENDIQGGFSPRPLLSVPHLVSDEASCYYHGYTLAEMSVHQTRAYFLKKYGYIVDNPNVGPDLTKAYWECGNSRPFLEIVKELTGKDLSGDDWVDTLKEDVDAKVVREKKEYEESMKRAAADSSSDDTLIDLNMTVKFVDGDEVIADSSTCKGGILEACKQFEDFVAARVAAAAKS